MLLQLLLPIFLLTALGCLLAKTRLIADGWQAGLTELTARLLIPAFLFSGSYKNGIPASVSWQVLAAFFIPLLALFLAAAYAFRRDAPRALAATYSNTVFVGIPVILQAFGPASLQYAFPIIAFHPVGVNAAALVQADGKNASVVSSAILLSSLLCTATIPLWISIVRTL